MRVQGDISVDGIIEDKNILVDEGQDPLQGFSLEFLQILMAHIDISVIFLDLVGQYF
jgi:hypothetical protein